MNLIFILSSFIRFVSPFIKYGESLTADKRAEIIGREEAAAVERMPYDTTTATGKLAASLITGLIVGFKFFDF